MEQMDEDDLEGLLKRLLDETETGLWRTNWWRMLMMTMMLLS